MIDVRISVALADFQRHLPYLRLYYRMTIILRKCKAVMRSWHR